MEYGDKFNELVRGDGMYRIVEMISTVWSMKSTINITTSVPQRMGFEDFFSLMEQKSVL